MSFWIGDWVKHKGTGLTGKYEGADTAGFANIKVGEEYVKLKESQLILLTEKEIKAQDKTESQNTQSLKKNKSSHKPMGDTLDLHIEKLAPHLKNKQVELILLNQINKCKQFICQAVERRKYSVVIIHGKGTGALKMEIENLLKGLEEVYFTRPIHNGGAIEVIFRYS